MSTPSTKSPQRKPFRLSDRLKSFSWALAGIVKAYRDQHNLWIHSAAALIVAALAFWLQLGSQDWAVLVLTIVMVVSTELINSAIEAAVDLASPELHPLAARAKDIAAGAVLVTAAGSVLIGLLILGPPLIEKFG